MLVCGVEELERIKEFKYCERGVTNTELVVVIGRKVGTGDAVEVTVVVDEAGGWICLIRSAR